jgi:hypothetical protein
MLSIREKGRRRKIDSRYPKSNLIVCKGYPRKRDALLGHCVI